MKALRKLKKGPGNMGLVDIPEPEIGDDDVLMKVWATGVCGSDLLIEEDKHFNDPPVTLGHEFAGIAQEVGKNVKKVKPGDKFVADIETETGWLGVTRDGSYAKYMVVPEAQAYVVPDHVSLDHAVFTELIVGTVHHMMERSRVKPGDTVTVVGPGPMGLIGVQFAKFCGARKVILIGLKKDELRLNIGKKVGADHILYSEEEPEKEVMEITKGIGSDFVLECSASEKGVQHAIDCARRSPEGRGGNGVIDLISLWGKPVTIDLDAVSLYQLTINGAWSWNGGETWQRAVDLVSRGIFDFDSLLTNKYSLEEWETAFKNLRDKKDIKALIYPDKEDIGK